jgi:hypothetical protein
MSKVVFPALLLSTACLFPSPESTRSPVEVAETYVKQCKVEDDDSRVIDVSNILSVAPAYATVPTSNNNSQTRLLGAEIRLRAQPGLSRVWVDHVLRCHESARLRGASTMADADNDPFWLPGKWLDVDVREDQGLFVVQLTHYEVAPAKAELERARRASATSR